MGRRLVRGNPRLVVGYVRASTEEQALGPEAQRAALARWCEANGAQLVETHDDLGVSGGAPLERRMGLLAALDAVRRFGAGVILVAKRDRLARDVMISAMVERLVDRDGARILAADGTASGEGPEAQLMRTMVDAFAQYERALIRARTKAALGMKKLRGQRVGSVPFGYLVGTDGATLHPEAGEQAVIERVRVLRAEGLPIRAIVETLNAEGRPARGARWHVTSVARLLRRFAA